MARGECKGDPAGGESKMAEDKQAKVHTAVPGGCQRWYACPKSVVLYVSHTKPRRLSVGCNIGAIDARCRLCDPEASGNGVDCTMASASGDYSCSYSRSGSSRRL